MIVPDVIVEVHFAKLHQNHTVFNIYRKPVVFSEFLYSQEFAGG